MGNISLLGASGVSTIEELTTSIGNTHVAYSNGTNLKGEAAFTYDEGTNTLTATNIAGTITTATQAQIDHNSLLNFDSNEHFTEASIDHTAITNIGTNSHAQIDTHIALTNEHIDWTSTSSNLSTSGTIDGVNVTSGSEPGHSHLAASLPNVETLTTSLLSGSVVYSDGSNLSEDNNNYFWDITNARLGLGTNSPSSQLHVLQTYSTSGNNNQITTQSTTNLANSEEIVNNTLWDANIINTHGYSGVIEDASATFKGLDIALTNNTNSSADWQDGGETCIVYDTFLNRGGSFTGLRMVTENIGYNIFLISSPSYNNASGTFEATNYGSKILLQSQGVVTSGTLTRNNYGQYIDIQSNTAGNTSSYGIYIQGVDGDATYGFYLNEASTTCKNLLGKDNVKTFFGTSEDASIYYDGTNLVINTQNVGSGSLLIPTTSGVDYNPGSDVNVDIATIVVTGSPTFGWVEASDKFNFTHGLISAGVISSTNIPATLTAGSVIFSNGTILSEDAGSDFVWNSTTQALLIARGSTTPTDSTYERLGVYTGHPSWPNGCITFEFGGNGANGNFDSAGSASVGMVFRDLNAAKTGAIFSDNSNNLVFENFNGNSTFKITSLGLNSVNFVVDLTNPGFNFDPQIHVMSGGGKESGFYRDTYSTVVRSKFYAVVNRKEVMTFRENQIGINAGITNMDMDGTLEINVIETGHMGIKIKGVASQTADQFQILNSADTELFSIDADGDVFITQDTKALFFGAGSDASIYYDATDFVIDPDIVGSGRVLIGATGDDNLNSNTVRLTGDDAGAASTNTITGSVDTPTTDPGWTSSDSVAMNAPDGYIKAYVGTQAVVIPYWNT